MTSEIMKIVEPVMEQAIREESRESALTCVSVVLLATMRPKNRAEWAYAMLKAAFGLTDEQIREGAIRTSGVLAKAMNLDPSSPDWDTEIGKIIDLLMTRVEQTNKEETASPK